MRNLKKFLALALAMLMLVSCFSVAAFDDVKDDSKYAEAVSLLSDLKVIRGFSASEFKPEENVTRWQMALMIAKLCTGKVEETDARWYDVTNLTSFNDLKVDHYYGSIGYCFGNDIIVGEDAVTFNPERGIMFQEALAMAVRALGYASGDAKAEMNAGYPWTYVNKAVALNLDENLEDVNYEQTLTRAQTAQLLYNMLTAAKKTGTTFAKDAFNLTQATIVLTATNKVNVLGGDPVIKANYVQFRVLKENGQLGAVAYHCQKSELGITDDAEKYLYNSYNILTQDDYESFVKVNKVEAVTTAKVAKANAGKITVDGTTYKLVGEYTNLNNKPTNKYTEPEIIVLNENAGYALMTKYETTTAYPEMVLFDDNLDGNYDRGLYKDYQLGQYMSTSRIADVAGSGTTTILYNPIFVGLKPAANDKIVYSYNEAANVLYVKEKAQKVSGVIGGLNTVTGKIVVGGVEYPIGVANLPGAWTAAKLTTDMLGKNASIYTIDGKMVYFTDYAKSSKLVVFDSYIALNQLGYPNVYAYVQNNVKEVITVSSFNFRSYEYYNYSNPTGGSTWFSQPIMDAARGQLFTGTVDLNGYYNLSDSVSLTSNSAAKDMVLQPYTNNRVTFNGTTYNLTDNTVFILVDAAGNIQTAKGLYANVNLPTAATTLLTVNGNFKISASSSNITYLYAQNATFATGVKFSQSAKAADTVVYLDEDTTLVTSQQINKVDAYTWEYTYANAIDVVNGGLLPYNIVCYNYPLQAGNFYLINDGVVVEKIIPDQAASDRNIYIKSYAPGAGLTGGKNSNNYVTFADTKYYNMDLVGFVMIDGNVKNTDASNVAPKNYGTTAGWYGAASQHTQYAYNYSLIVPTIDGNYVGGAATPNFVVFTVYADDFNSFGYPTIFTRENNGLEPKTTVSVSSAPAFVEYIYYKGTNAATTNGGWDALRSIVGGTAQGDVDVTNALKLYKADGTYIDAAKYGLTYTVKDATITAYNLRYTCLEIRRDPLNKEVLPAAADYYFTHVSNGSVYMHQKITINLADASVWTVATNTAAIDKITATAGSYEFTVFVKLDTAKVSVAQIEKVFNTLRTTIFKDGQYWDDVATPINYQWIGGTEVAFTFAAHQNFQAGGNYGFALSFFDTALTGVTARDITLA